MGLYSWVCKHVQQWASTASIHPAGGRTHSDYKMEWQTIKSVWVSYRVRSPLGAEWHRSLPLTNHSPAGTQRSSHTAWSIFRQVAALGFSFTVTAEYVFCKLHGSIYNREIKVGPLFSERKQWFKYQMRVLIHSIMDHTSDVTSGCWCNRGIMERCMVEAVSLPWRCYLLHPILQWCIRRCMHSGVKRAPREHQNKWFAVSA